MTAYPKRAKALRKVSPVKRLERAVAAKSSNTGVAIAKIKRIVKAIS